jgi:thiamine kinase-like enzyme
MVFHFVFLLLNLICLTKSNAIEEIDQLMHEFLGFIPKNSDISTLPSFTNKNYLVQLESGEKYVLRFPGDGTNFFILREAEIYNALQAFHLGFNPAEIIFFEIGKGTQITKYIENLIPLSWDELYQKENIQHITRLLKSIHTSPLNFANKIDIFDRIDKLMSLLGDRGFSMPEDFERTRQSMELLRPYLSLSSFKWAPSHGDPVPSNFVRTSQGLQLFDWEYSGKNDPSWDLAFLSTVMNYTSDLDQFLIQCYDEMNAHLVHSKMVFFKPLIEFWLGLWALLQSATRQTIAEKDFFIYFAMARLHKSQNYMKKSDFDLALTIIGNK